MAMHVHGHWASRCIQGHVLRSPEMRCVETPLRALLVSELISQESGRASLVLDGLGSQEADGSTTTNLMFLCRYGDCYILSGVAWT